jgi:hypothetical protein
MERMFTAERAAHARAVAEAPGSQVGRPRAHCTDKIDYAPARAQRDPSTAGPVVPHQKHSTATLPLLDR